MVMISIRVEPASRVPRKKTTRRLCSLALPLVLAIVGWALPVHAEEPASNSGAAAQGPVFSDTGPDAAAYGAAKGFPLGDRATASQVEHLVATLSHFDEMFPTRRVPRATEAWRFKRSPEPAISDNFGRERLAIETYLGDNPTTGLLIARDDTILYEFIATRAPIVTASSRNLW